ncbi:hypothetical protein [Streptomyces sp. CT34]|uniref:hypothetical protein n=1 Tax=Streptomyces sp. CT34 TaxID=1553907 RepID=UPI000A618804|nr:hypothetical protein [Streptomyces sp. CT34]
MEDMKKIESFANSTLTLPMGEEADKFIQEVAPVITSTLSSDMNINNHGCVVGW